MSSHLPEIFNSKILPVLTLCSALVGCNESRFEIAGDPNGNRIRIIGGEVRLLGYETREDGYLELKEYDPEDEIGFDEGEWNEFYQYDILASIDEWQHAVIGIRFELEYYNDPSPGLNNCPGCAGPDDQINSMEFLWELPDGTLSENMSDLLYGNHGVFFIPAELINSDDFETSDSVRGAYDSYLYDFIQNFRIEYNERGQQIQDNKLGQEFYFFVWTYRVDRKLKESGNINCYIEFNDRKIKLTGTR